MRCCLLISISETSWKPTGRQKYTVAGSRIRRWRTASRTRSSSLVGLPTCYIRNIFFEGCLALSVFLPVALIVDENTCGWVVFFRANLGTFGMESKHNRPVHCLHQMFLETRELHSRFLRRVSLCQTPHSGVSQLSPSTNLIGHGMMTRPRPQQHQSNQLQF